MIRLDTQPPKPARVQGGETDVKPSEGRKAGAKVPSSRPRQGFDSPSAHRNKTDRKMTKRHLTLERLTPLQKQRQERNKALAAEYRQLAGTPGQSLTNLRYYLMQKHGLHSPSAYYKILKDEGVPYAGKEGA